MRKSRCCATRGADTYICPSQDVSGAGGNTQIALANQLAVILFKLVHRWDLLIIIIYFGVVVEVKEAYGNILSLFSPPVKMACAMEPYVWERKGETKDMANG